MKKFFVLMLLIVLAFSCKKKDTISSQTIHGQVYSLCTGNGMANITVYLSASGAALDPATTLNTVSDANGNFSFTNAQIHSSSEYEYSLYIPSKSGIGGVDVGFDGGEWNVNKDKLSTKFVLDVTASFKSWHIYLPSGTHITSNDTFVLTVQQNILHQLFPSHVYQVIESFPPPPLPQFPSNFISALGNYPMGWWQVSIDKTKNGIHTFWTDSIYVDYGAAQTDTIPW